MTVLNNKPAAINRDLTYAEQRLGTDLKITEAGDLEISNAGDFKMIAGVRNASQAFQLKMLTEPGANRYHPEIGVTIPIGEKSVAAFQIRAEILKTLAQDDRFKNVNVFVKVLGNIYSVDIQLQVVDRTIQIPLQFVVENQ